MAERGDPRRDPLGKQALFWAPAARREPGPADPAPGAAGKRALFSAYGDGEPATAEAGRSRPTGRSRPAGPPREAADPPLAAGRPGTVWLHCGTCGAQRAVDLLHYARLHLPLFLVRPGRGFTRFMTCPACRRRTWLSASLRPPA